MDNSSWRCLLPSDHEFQKKVCNMTSCTYFTKNRMSPSHWDIVSVGKSLLNVSLWETRIVSLFLQLLSFLGLWGYVCIDLSPWNTSFLKWVFIDDTTLYYIYSILLLFLFFKRLGLILLLRLECSGCDHNSLQCRNPGLKPSSHLSLPSS